MKKYFCILILTVLFFGGCARADNFVGVWKNEKALVPWIKIEQDGEYYKVTSPITGPIRAIKKEGVLYISDCEFRQPVHYDSNTEELIYCDVKYKRK